MISATYIFINTVGQLPVIIQSEESSLPSLKIVTKITTMNTFMEQGLISMPDKGHLTGTSGKCLVYFLGYRTMDILYLCLSHLDMSGHLTCTSGDYLVHFYLLQDNCPVPLFMDICHCIELEWTDCNDRSFFFNSYSLTFVNNNFLILQIFITGKNVGIGSDKKHQLHLAINYF